MDTVQDTFNGSFGASGWKADCQARTSNPTVRVQNVLMQKLEIVNVAQSPDREAFNRFQAIFAISAAPLSASKHEALQALFSDGVDPVVMELDFAGLEHNVL
jgi:hypothetical protein